MNTLATIGGTDITPYIDWENYKIESQDVYQSWPDGNFVEHRIYVRTRLAGKIRLWLCGKNGMDTDAFIALLNGATTNKKTLMGLYDQSTNSFKAVEAFCRLVPEKHGEMINGNYFDVFTLEVTER